MIISEVPETFVNRPDAVLLSKHIVRVLNKPNSVIPARNKSSITIEGDFTEGEMTPVLVGYNSLAMSATLSTITANGVQETIITSAGLTSFDYRVWQNGAVIASGIVNDGSLDFSTNEAGIYLMEIINGNNTGYMEIVANG